MSTPPDVFIYDGDCGICQSAVRWLRDRADGSVEFAPANDALLLQLHVDPREAQQAVLLVARSGRVLQRGSLAFGEVLRRSPKYDRNLAGRLLLDSPTRQLASMVYSWVAKNRHRLSGGGRACGLVS